MDPKERCKLPSGIRGEALGDLASQNVTYKAATDVDFADIEFISVKFLWESKP